MSHEKSLSRLTLHQLLTLAEKSSRDLAEHLQRNLLANLSEFRDLSRPVRRRTHYPTLRTIGNALKKLQRFEDEAQNLINNLNEYLQAIDEHARQESQRQSKK